MTKFLTLCIFIFLSLNSYGQNGDLILSNRTTGKIKTIHQGKKVKVICQDGKIVKGKITFVNDSTIILGNSVVALNQITTIKMNPFTKIGDKLMIAGSVFTISGGAALTTVFLIDALTGAWAFAFLSAMTLTPTGLLIIIPATVLLSVKKNYSTENWNFKIVMK
jgi:hypothetical protein